MKRLLVLEDGSTYEGIAIGSDNYKIGELVFNTSVSGYQEVFTDLSSAGQIVVMTYPLIGNCGINRDDYESINPSVYGIVIKDEDLSNSNFAGCRLQNAIFQDCNMYKTNFNFAIMEKILFDLI